MVTAAANAAERRPRAEIRTEPDDFVVAEIPAYEPSGVGGYAFLTLDKRSVTTLEAVRCVARHLDLKPDAVSFAGMKDRHAVTRQRISLPWGAERPLTDLMACLHDIAPPVGGSLSFSEPSRHSHGLKPGHLRGNRFQLRLRGLSAERAEHVAEGLHRIGRQGLPNRFGPQRFGRHGTLGEDALNWVRGEAKPPRDRRQRRLWFSAFQSLLFNRVLDARLADDSVYTVVFGDLAQKHDTGGMFDVPLGAGPEFDDAVGRAERALISATGPMFGNKMRLPLQDGAPRRLEEAVLRSALGPDADLSVLKPFKTMGAGTRRPLRLVPEAMTTSARPDGLVCAFVLPKGGYATTVLEQVCVPIDVSSP
ncbi:MAG: tRNA pseudouridine(13) synthase TruD [Myxococcota bacterium]